MVLITAATWLIGSFVLHVLTFTTLTFRYNVNTLATVVFSPLPFLAIPTFLTTKTLGEGLSTFDRKTLQFAPPPLRVLWFAFFGYMFLTMLLVMKDSPMVQGGGRIHWDTSPQLGVRIFMAFAMCFYYGVVVVQYSSLNVRRPTKSY